MGTKPNSYRLIYKYADSLMGCHLSLSWGIGSFARVTLFVMKDLLSGFGEGPRGLTSMAVVKDLPLFGLMEVSG